MKQLREQFNGDELIAYLHSEMIEEGAVGDFFKKTFNYLKGKITQIGSYFVALFNDKVLPVITPITSQIALKDGDIPDSRGIHWMGTKEDAKYSGVTTNGNEILSSRESTLEMWSNAARRKGIREALEGTASDEVLESLSKPSKFSQEEQLDEALKLASDNKSLRNIDGEELERLATITIRKGVNAVPLLIWGAPGVGKTSIINKVLKSLKGEDARLLDMQLSMKDHDDFFLPSYNVTKTKAVDLPKSYLPVWEDLDSMTDEERKAADEACGKGLIFLDELSRAKPQVQNVCLKLVAERKLGDTYKLGSGWSIIAASNRLEDDESAQFSLSSALGNRFRQVNYSPTCKSWRKWADKQGFMNKHVLDWLEQNEKYFYFQDEQNDLLGPNTVFASPRTWEYACRCMADEAYTADEEGFDLMSLPESSIMAALQDTVGLEPARAFMDYVKLIKTINIEDLKKVFTDPDKAPLPKKEGNEYKLDIMYIITTTLLSFIKKEPTSEEFVNICKYYARLKHESATSKMLKCLFEKFPEMNQKLGENGGDNKFAAGYDIIVAAYPEWDEADLS